MRGRRSQSGPTSGRPLVTSRCSNQWKLFRALSQALEFDRIYRIDRIKTEELPSWFLFEYEDENDDPPSRGYGEAREDDEES